MRWRRRVVVTLVVVVVVAGFGILGALDVARASKDLRDAQDLVDTASTALQEGEIGAALAALETAEGLVLSANESIRTSVVLDVAGILPGVSDNIRSLEGSMDIAATVIHGGTKILEEAGPLQSTSGQLEVSLSDGTFPLTAIEGSNAEITRLVDELLLTDPPATGTMLLPQVRELQETVTAEALRRRDQLGVLGRGLDLVEEFAGANGPRRYLIAVANTAEMRGSGGMILNYGVLEGRDGTIDLTDFGRVDELGLTGSVSEDLVPEDYLARWAGFDSLSRFRQANLSADFTVIAPVLEAMYTRATSLPVNGVIQVDPDGLAAILDGVGPVTVPELGSVDGDNVVDLTMNEAYVRFPGVEERSDVLGDVAEAAFTRLVEGEVPSLRTLATRIAESVDARHIMMHTDSESLQRDLVAFGADGSLPDLEESDAFSVTIQNLAGNKLDYYVDSSLELSGEVLGGEVGEVEATVRVANRAPAGVSEPRYIYGPAILGQSPPPGVIRSLVTIYLPVGTSVADSSGNATVGPMTSGTEAGRPYATYTVDLPASEEHVMTMRLRVAPRPAGEREILVVPSPRIRPTTVDIDIATGGDAIVGAVSATETFRFAEGEEPVSVVAPAFRARGW